MNNIIKEKLSDPTLSETEAKQISEYILLSKDVELNYYAAKHSKINKINHLQLVIESKDPLYNYRCIKYLIKSNDFNSEDKKVLIAFHSQVIYSSNNEKLKNELSKFLKYNRINKEHKQIRKNKIRKKAK